MKILLLTGPSQVGKSHSSTEYCQSHPAARIDGDALFNHWFTEIGQAEYIYKKGSFRDWEHLIADERTARVLRASHQQKVGKQAHEQVILEGVMYRHALVRNVLFTAHDPHHNYGLVDYRRTKGDFVRQAIGKRDYYATEAACLGSWSSHADQFEPPPHHWFSRQVLTHQGFVEAAREFFGNGSGEIVFRG